MSLNPFNTPVALIIFNRPETTRKVLDAVREVKPRQLFVIADAPKSDKDEIKCEATRKVIDEVDWECEIHKKYAETNLGCGKGPAEGISWVFEHVESCIILEDDCVPHVDFFRFCEELLQKYQNDKRIMMISGNHHLLKECEFEYSYFFSRHTQTWGWATWKRAWDLFDYEMSLWPEVKKSGWLTRIMGPGVNIKYWEGLFDQCYSDQKRDYWDFQWTFSCWAQNGLNIIPDRNLVSNIGFGEFGGTRFANSTFPFANLEVHPMQFPLTHPPAVMQNIKADRQIEKDVYGRVPLYFRVKRKFAQLLNKANIFS